MFFNDQDYTTRYSSDVTEPPRVFSGVTDVLEQVPRVSSEASDALESEAFNQLPIVSSGSSNDLEPIPRVLSEGIDAWDQATRVSSESTVEVKFFPKNYDEIPFLIEGQIYNVCALAMPSFGGQDPYEVMSFLRLRNVKIIFGFEVEEIFSSIAKEYDIEYINAQIPDFTAPSMERFQEICDAMTSCVGTEKIAIHCRGGIGRTGVILAALKLKEMSCNDSFACSPMTGRIYLYHHRMQCSDNVAMAIASIRKTRYAVEAKEQLDFLHQVEAIFAPEEYTLTSPTYY